MTAYYNEFDPKAASWLRELIKQGHIAPGEVDERSIVEVRPDDLVGYDQCHFFAGIGVWSYALRKAGWSDDRPVWTGSCPCQPFSAAGKRGGTDDARHFWPEFFRFIAECRPVTVFGEQVASKDGLAWLDAVHVDLEGAGYAVGAVDTCVAGFGAPHIRQRLYFVADAAEQRHERRIQESHQGGAGLNERVATGLLADADHQGPQGRRREQLQERAGECAVGSDGGVGELADALGRGQQDGRREDVGALRTLRERRDPASLIGTTLEEPSPGACNGFWSNAVWLPCRDGKWRAVEPGDESLVDGFAGDLGLVRLVSYPDRPHEERIIYSPLIQKGKARVMRLRGYGNAIVAPQATAFIQAYGEVTG